jgi:ADP-heptose:LPS heptosyltransferase
MTRSILFVVPARLGDALMLTPALSLLKQLKPGYSIDILGFGALGNNVYTNNPNCRAKYLISEIGNWGEFLQPYDFVVVAHPDTKVEDLLPKINRPAVLIEPADQQQVQAQQALNFIQRVFADDQKQASTIGYQLFPEAEDEQYIARLLPQEIHYIGLHLGCHGINKKDGVFAWRKRKGHKKIWPLENFLQLSQEIKRRHLNYQIVLTGGDNESHLAYEFMRHFPDATNLAGKTNVLQLAALMRRLSAYICSDTGPMHVACAMGVPLITLFGPTNKLRTGPYPASEHRCSIQSSDLAKLSHADVLVKLEELSR